MNNLVTIFNKFDTDNDGLIDSYVFKQILNMFDIIVHNDKLNSRVYTLKDVESFIQNNNKNNQTNNDEFNNFLLTNYDQKTAMIIMEQLGKNSNDVNVIKSFFSVQ